METNDRFYFNPKKEEEMRKGRPAKSLKKTAKSMKKLMRSDISTRQPHRPSMLNSSFLPRIVNPLDGSILSSISSDDSDLIGIFEDAAGMA